MGRVSALGISVVSAVTSSIGVGSEVLSATGVSVVSAVGSSAPVSSTVGAALSVGTEVGASVDNTLSVGRGVARAAGVSLGVGTGVAVPSSPETTKEPIRSIKIRIANVAGLRRRELVFFIAYHPIGYVRCLL